MICFEGQLAENSRKRVIKEIVKSYLLISAVVVVISLIPLGTIIGTDEINYFSICWMALWLLFAAFIPFWPYIDIKKGFSTRIEIEDGYLTCNFISRTELYGKSLYRNIEYVKKVIDFGEYYCIYFSFPHRFLGCVCQKNLITQGTIEEFEDLFKDKIIRKT